MLEVAELGAKVDAESYDAAVPGLRVRLINAHYDLHQAPSSFLLLLAGDDFAGASEMVNVLNEWMDARYIHTRAFGAPYPDELERPRFWRYWLSLPPAGRMALYLGGWPLLAIRDRLRKEIGEQDLERRFEQIRNFERALVDDGALILKIWLHMPRSAFKKRLRAGRRSSGKALQVSEFDRVLYEDYERIVPLAERTLRETSTAEAPWQVVESTDARHRDLEVARHVLETLEKRVSSGPAPAPRSATAGSSSTVGPGNGRLAAVDLTAKLDYDSYKQQLTELQVELRRLSPRAQKRGVSSVVVLEGWDAAGKGGVIRRITRAVDAWRYQVIPIAAPTEEERARHWLWRFWRQLPRAGRMVIFDRSWYGRVLVERVEGLADEGAWRRAYAEINDFEEQLVEHGIPVVKFWLHVDPDEQMRRFRERERTPYKKYKITEEDYRNRARWDDYVAAIDEMVARTSTDLASWHLIAANDKRWARVEVMKILVGALDDAVARARKR